MDVNVRALTIALLFVFAVSLGAATLADTQSQGGDGDGTGPGPQAGPSNSDPSHGEDGVDRTTQRPQSDANPVQVTGACFPFLTTPAFFVLAAAVVAAAVLVASRRTSRQIAVVGVGIVTVAVSPLWVFFTDCHRSVTNERGSAIPPLPAGEAGQSGGGGGSGSATSQLLSPTVLLAAVLVVTAVLVLLVYWASRGEDGTDGDSEADAGAADEPAEDAPLAAVGAAAGEAADRIEEAADVDNEVYRAWREMTDHVDVAEPATSTPGEFAEAARDAGMQERHVETLTELFRDVRYGDADPTEDREERATQALRGIEDEYAAS